MTTRARLQVALFAALTAAGLALSASLLAGPSPQALKVEPVSDPVDEGPLVAGGPAPDLVLVYTGGVVGFVDPCG